MRETGGAMALHLAGYQGDASILTAALRRLGEQLAESGPPPHVEADVTAAGESAAALFASLEQGRRHIGYMASGYLAARVPELGVLDLPFSVTDRTAAMAALDGDAGTLLRHAVHERTGYHVLGFWDNGFRHLSNAVRPLRRPADCAGLAIRTLDNQAYRDLFDALGFQAVSLDVKELVGAVASGRVQAQENPLTNLIGFELWRHHRYLSLSGHLFGVLLLLCPRAWHEALPVSQRHVLAAAAAEATTLQRRLAAEQDRQALARLRDLGMLVLQHDELDLPELHAAAAPLAARLRGALPPALLRAYLPPSTTPTTVIA